MTKKIKIENVPVGQSKFGKGRRTPSRIPNVDLMGAMQRLDVGQSFVVESIDANHRTLIGICGSWSGWTFRCVKQDDGTYRVGRVK